MPAAWFTIEQHDFEKARPKNNATPKTKAPRRSSTSQDSSGANPAILELLEEILPKNARCENFEVDAEFVGVGPKRPPGG